MTNPSTAASAARTALVLGLAGVWACALGTPRVSVNVSEAARSRAAVEAHIFSALDSTQQAKLIAAGAYTPPRGSIGASALDKPRLGDEGYAVVRKIVSRAAFDRMIPAHQHALVGMVEMQADGLRPPALCFSPDTDESIVAAFDAAANMQFHSRFQASNRWTQTATNGSISGGSSALNRPVTLTYSFVPDGTIVPTLTNGTNTPSDLFARMAVIYNTSDPTVWQAHYASVLSRWSQITGVRYVLEPNDDGVAMGASGSSGSLGVRGDCRFAGTPLDGNSNVLAFNYYPGTNAGGDCVLDTNDSFYTSTSNNSRRLRNVMAHEHGHGLGMRHVCPTNSSKLMEPFISTAYDGPQIDDIMLGQRFYGDTNEPNDTSATATNITDLDATTRSVTNLSSNGQADLDWFRFTLAAPAKVTISATPIGGNYLDGPQNSNGSCTAGTTYNAGTVNSLAVTIYAADGATVLDASLSAAQGQIVQAEAAVPAGTFYARVSPGRNNDFIQGYNLSYTANSTPGLVFRLPSGPPQRVSPSTGANVSARISAVSTTIVANTPTLWYRFGTGAYQSAAMTAGAGGLYSASIPAAPCGSAVQYYIGASSAAAGAAVYPAGAPASALNAPVNDETIVFSDDFSTNKGWSYSDVADTATSGQWTRGTPVASSAPSGQRAQTGLCFSGTHCAFTGQGVSGQSATTNDVDGGAASLTSPPMDLSGTTAPVLTYMRWFFNNAGGAPQSRPFRVQISNDGTTWIPVENVGPVGVQVSGGWFAATIQVNSYLPTPGTAVRVRFIADDAAGTDAATIEAAIDDFKVAWYPCVAPPSPCEEDFDGVGGLSVQDIFSFLSAWFAGDVRTDWNNSGGLDVQDIFTFMSAWLGGCP